MQRALSREPQLAVVTNLLPQCAADVELVPGRIGVSASLARLAADHDSDMTRESTSLAPLIEISRATIPTLIAMLETEISALPECRLQVPHDAPTGLALMLRTCIETMPGLRLEDYDSGLTCPHFELSLGTIAPGDWLGFTYRLGRDPGFIVRRLDATSEPADSFRGDADR
jgi:hypothetical protein